MRIIAGKFKGRKIIQPMLGTVRPTKDRIRESVFNIIAGEIAGTEVLDLFAGSGAYGIEALSRGASRAVFVEKSNKCCGIIKKNLQLFSIEAQTEVQTIDTFKSLELFTENQRKFDLIFSDPPYNKGLAKKTLIMINHYDILRPTGLLIIEHHKDEHICEVEKKLSLLKQKSYKDISISIFLRQ